MVGYHVNAAHSAISIFSGGTAANSLVDVFDRIAERQSCKVDYIIPISDNGGSSSELIRFIGGPSVGDIRSRLVRLIPNRDGNEERTALRTLFEYRLCSDPIKARAEWLDIVEGRHLLWTFITSAKRDLIRSVLNTLNMEIVKRTRPSSAFNFAKASVGNLFLTGARLFTGSFESSIYLLAMICSIPDHVSVLPAINSNFTHHIAAGLADGSQITGQTAISHPSAPTSIPDSAVEPAPLSSFYRERIEDASLPGSLPILRQPQITFSKHDEEDLPARIERIWYINPYGHEIWPAPNPKAVAAIQNSSAIIYSIGSLYTSIIPSLVLRGVGSAIAGSAARHKVLILNSSLDRETGPRTEPLTAADFVLAVAGAALQSTLGPRDVTGGPAQYVRRYVTHLVYTEDATAVGGGGGGGGGPLVDEAQLARLQVTCVKVAGRKGGGSFVKYDEDGLVDALAGIIGQT